MGCSFYVTVNASLTRPLSISFLKRTLLHGVSQPQSVATNIKLARQYTNKIPDFVEKRLSSSQNVARECTDEINASILRTSCNERVTIYTHQLLQLET